MIKKYFTGKNFTNTVLLSLAVTVVAMITAGSLLPQPWGGIVSLLMLFFTAVLAVYDVVYNNFKLP